MPQLRTANRATAALRARAPLALILEIDAVRFELTMQQQLSNQAVCAAQILHAVPGS